MTDVQTDVPINGAGHPGKKKITGRELAAWLAHASMLTKLCVAAAIAARELEVGDPTIPHIARMIGVKSKQIRAMMELSPEQRAALITKRRVNGVGRFSNEVIDDFVQTVGPNRLWAAIDRATMPKTNGMNGHAA
jgi:hypothetical protein